MKLTKKAELKLGSEFLRIKYANEEVEAMEKSFAGQWLIISHIAEWGTPHRLNIRFFLFDVEYFLRHSRKC
jgi:hypothetical protein